MAKKIFLFLRWTHLINKYLIKQTNNLFMYHLLKVNFKFNLDF
jgi:hypothetical protein